MAKGGSRPSAAKGKGSKVPKDDGKAFTKLETQDAAVSLNGIEQVLQQRCLNVFRDTLRPSSDDSAILQEVKGHLYNRDFAAAFGKDEYLRVYASRWSPSRALGYLEVFKSLTEEILSKESSTQAIGSGSVLNIICLGGGAGGELVSLAGWLHARMKDSPSSSVRKIHVSLIDIADWTQVTATLHNGITTPPELSKYASQVKKDANRALVDPDAFSVSFQQMNILESNKESLCKIFASADLVTSMFTMNELYSTSVSKTQELLSNTMDSMQPGSHLLVVDSPGSYSTVSLNGAEKKYPMQWLLNYALVETPRKGETQDKAKWEQVTSDDSRWFRLPGALEYPIELENMRYQMHLYRRRSDNGE